MRSLRSRLIFSHILPVMITVPLIGLAFTYLLQTQVLLDTLTREARNQAVLLVEYTSQQVDLWYSPDNARAFVTRISPQLKSRVMMFDNRGNLLAASDPSTLSPNAALDLPRLTDALKGQASLEIVDEPESTGETVQMLTPVTGSNGEILGIIRLNLPVASFQERIVNARSAMIWVLVGGLILGAGLGWVLAVSIERPLHRTTRALSDLSSGQRLEPVAEEGPDELRMLTRAFNTLAGRLQTLQNSRRRLLANLTHELGRPLGAMRSAVDALQNGAAEDEALRSEMLLGIGGEVRRLERLLADLASLNDQVVGSLELNRKNVALLPWLQQVLVPWREAALEKKLIWEVDIPAELPILNIDSDRIAQALGNLLSNAVKYSPAGQKIRVEVAARAEQVTIAVQDTGLGVPESEQKDIFLAFQRGSSAGRLKEGMGLGLTIAQDLVQAHGGKIDFSSEPNKGSRFVIVLPRNAPGQIS